MRQWIIGIAAALFFCGVMAADANPAGKYTPEKIQELVKLLGNEDFAARKAAEAELAQAGAAALPAVEGAQNSTDPEVKAAVGRLLPALRVANLGTVNYFDIFPATTVAAVRA